MLSQHHGACQIRPTGVKLRHLSNRYCTNKLWKIIALDLRILTCSQFLLAPTNPHVITVLCYSAVHGCLAGEFLNSKVEASH